MIDRKPSVIILHGWKLAARKYSDLERELRRKGYDVYVPDMPGNGTEPDPPVPFTLGDYGHFVEQFMLRQNCKECIVIGHSFGGRVAIKLASRNPTLVKKLILTGAPGFPTVPAYKVKLCLVLAKLGNKMFSLPIVNRTKGAIRKLSYSLIGARDYYNAKGIVMRRTFKNIVGEDLVGLMRHLTVQTLLIYGKGDKIVPPWIPEKMRRVIPSAELKLIAGVGHDLPCSRPKLFIEKANL